MQIKHKLLLPRFIFYLRAVFCSDFPLRFLLERGLLFHQKGYIKT